MQISADEQLIRQEVETNTVLATSLVVGGKKEFGRSMKETRNSMCSLFVV